MTKAYDRANPFEPLPDIERGWPCIAADPPLRFRSNSVARPGRNALRHYPCLSAEEVATLPVASIAAEAAFLFYWTTGPVIATGAHLPIMLAWGFEPTAIAFVWVKTNPRAPTLFFTERDLFFGPGLTTRKNSEYVILGKRGQPKRLARDVFEVVVAPRREHSRKPSETYARIQRFCVGPRLELFARESRAGWTAWGDQASLFDAQRPVDALQPLPESRESPPASRLASPSGGCRMSAKLTLRCVDWRPRCRNTLRGFAAIHVADLRLTMLEIAVHEKNGRAWAQPPSRAWVKDGQLITGDDGRIKYQPLFEFDSAAMRDRFSAAAVEAVLAFDPQARRLAESTA